MDAGIDSGAGVFIKPLPVGGSVLGRQALRHCKMIVCSVDIVQTGQVCKNLGIPLCHEASLVHDMCDLVCCVEFAGQVCSDVFMDGGSVVRADTVEKVYKGVVVLSVGLCQNKDALRERWMFVAGGGGSDRLELEKVAA